jgi:hypothetical protein
VLPLFDRSGTAPRLPAWWSLPPLEAPVWRERTLLALLLAASFLACWQPVWDPDTFWHLAVGREIWQTGHLVRTETFSFTAPGVGWEDTEWLFHFLAFPLWKLGGDGLLALITGLCGAAVVGLAYRSARLAGGDAMTFSLYLLLVLGVLQGRMRFRPDLASLVLLAVLVEGLIRTDPRFPKPLRTALGVGFLFCLWAQWHGGWSFGLALLGAYLAGCALDALRERRLTPRYAGALGLVGASAVLALFANPYTWQIPWFPLKSLLGFADPTLVQIVEWSRTPFRGGFAVYLAASFALGAILLAGWKQLAWRVALPVWLQVFLGWYWVRYTAFSAVALAPLGALVLHRALKGRPRLQKVAWAAALFATAAAGFYHLARHPRSYDLSQKYPVQEVAFLNRHQLGGNLFHEYTVGGYLDWTAYPRSRIFMDGRYYPFMKPLQEYFEAHKTVPAYERFLRQYPFEIAFYPHPDFLIKAAGSTYAEVHRGPTVTLFPRDQWALVHFGNYGMLFLRRIDRFQEAIRQFEYKTLRPDDLRSLVKQAELGLLPKEELAREIRRKLEEDPHLSSRAALEKALSRLGASGDPPR